MSPLPPPESTRVENSVWDEVPLEKECSKEEEERPPSPLSKDGISENFYVLEPADAGTTKTTECDFVVGQENFLSPKRVIHREKPNISTRGYPSEAKTEGAYYYYLDRCECERHRFGLEEITSFLNDVHLNLRSKNPEAALYPSQVFDDIGRWDSIVFDGKKIYDTQDIAPEDGVEKSYEKVEQHILQMFSKQFDDDEEVAQKASIFVTQAVLAHPYAVLTERFNNIILGFHIVSHISQKIEVITRDKHNGNWAGTVTVKISAIFGLIQVNDSIPDGEHAPRPKRYVKVAREIVVETAYLSIGNLGTGWIHDVYSPFFHTLGEAESFENKAGWEPASVIGSVASVVRKFFGK